MFDYSLKLLTQVIVRNKKIRTDTQKMDDYMDVRQETIVPRHCRVVG